MVAIVKRPVPYLELLVPAHETGNQWGSAFEPQVVALMADALENAIAELPHPLPSRHAQTLATSILTQAAQGERDTARLSRVALDTMRQGS